MTSTPIGSPQRVKVHRGPRVAFSYLRFFRDPVGAIVEAYRRYGPLSAFGDVVPGRRGRLRVLALGPEFNRQVFGNPQLFRSTRLTVPGPSNSAHVRLSRGLTALNGDYHRIERKLAAPLFAKSASQAFQEEITRRIDTSLASWAVGSSVDLLEEAQRLVLDVTGAFLFGRTRLPAAVDLGFLLHGWMHRTWSPGVLLFPCDAPGTPYRSMLRLAEAIEARINAELTEHLDAIRDGGGALASWAEARARTPGVPLQWTVGQMATLFLASFETTTPSLAWTLFLLAQHPPVARALLDELDAALQGSPLDGAWERLPYLDAVIRESLRILPPVPYTLRRAAGDSDLGGVKLAKGDLVLVSHYLTHHLPELYPAPEEFRPERWFDANPDSFEYLPFSAGPRTCIGYFFAMSVLKTAVAAIIQRFRPRVVEGARIDRVVEVSMRPRHGLPMTLHGTGAELKAASVRGNIHEMVALRPW